MTNLFSISGSLEKQAADSPIQNEPALSLTLNRYPKSQVSQLQAWDAADEHLLNQLIQNQTLADINGSIAIINDNFGALSCAIAKMADNKKIFIETDAKTSALGIQENLTENQISSDTLANIHWLSSMDEFPEAPALVLMKLPKNLNYFASQLIRLSHVMPKDSQILIAAKAKSINASLLNLISKNLGIATASLTWKKGRVITVITDGIERKQISTQNWALPEYNLKVTNLSNVFAANKLDIGARLMIENMPKGDFNSVIDLGCGNGVLGLRAAQLYTNANVHFADDSDMAVKSSQENWLLNGFDSALGHFYWSDCLSQMDIENKVDLILCNPPFHQGEAITDHIAWQMFNDARKYLNNDGILHVVGNRHLGYHIKLQRLFGNCKTIASNGKFVILQAKK